MNIKSLILEFLAFYLRRSPWDRGRWRLLQAAVPLSGSLPPRPRYRTVRTRHGFLVRVNLGDWLGRHVFVTGDYEPPTARLIVSLLKPGDLFVDVGANIGFFTLLGSRCVGEAGRVVSFEPLAHARRELEENLVLNGVTNVVVHEEAVSDRTGEEAFYAGPENHQGTSSLRPLSGASEVTRVQTARLDDLLPTDRRVALVKLDIEGAEGKALDGMSSRLEKDQPDLVVEVTDPFLRAMGDSAQALRERLEKLGYRMFAIEESGLRPIEGDPANVGAQFNALFTTSPDRLTRSKSSI